MSTFSLIKNNKIFFNIWLAQLISNFGDSFYDVAIVLYVMSITNNSAFLAGGVAISSFIVQILSWALGGVVYSIFHSYIVKSLMFFIIDC